MKRKLRTFSHNINILQEIDNNGGLFTAEEHAYALEKEFGKTKFKSKENLLRDFLPRRLSTLDGLEIVINLIKENGYKNILSLGAGEFVNEYLLKMSLPEESKVVGCDFDLFLVNKAKEFFPEITAEQFDFKHDNFASLQSKLNIKFDIVIFFASACTMDDEDFVKLFSDLKIEGVSHIVDFHAGYMDTRAIISSYLLPLTTNPLIRKIFNKPQLNKYPGKFHGYQRSHGELQKLYKKSGLKVEKELSTSGTKYTAILS